MNCELQKKLVDHSVALVDLLASTRQRLVLAESCTAGLVSSSLATCPGVSQWLCGSWVTYRNASKIDWLGVDAETIDQQTAVCHEVARQMAVGALQKTTEATLSAAITGHLGPQAPDGFDGLVFVAIANRTSKGCETLNSTRFQLVHRDRLSRQIEAATTVIDQLAKAMGAKWFVKA